MYLKKTIKRVEGNVMRSKKHLIMMKEIGIIFIVMVICGIYSFVINSNFNVCNFIKVVSLVISCIYIKYIDIRSKSWNLY